MNLKFYRRLRGDLKSKKFIKKISRLSTSEIDISECHQKPKVFEDSEEI